MTHAPATALCFCVLLCACFTTACSHTAVTPASGITTTLTLIFTGQNAEDVAFLSNELKIYREKTGVRTKGIEGSDSVDTRLNLLQELFLKHSPEPDLFEMDNIWPGLMADDLIDLKPYLGDDIVAFDKSLLDAFTVNGRLVAIPEFIDSPVLYYRTDLLKKYGFSQPPRTWDELGHMAKVIQDGERKAGKSDFWGYLWEGGEGEALTCTAMEWQRSDGANLFDSSGKLCAYNPAAEVAITRARSWVGTISPPSVIEYDEEDISNAWLAGSTAFARCWLSLYVPSRTSPILANKFATAALPAGRAGSAWTFGGMGWAVSRYSVHQKEAARLACHLVSEALQRRRMIATSTIPSRTKLLQDSALFENSAFNGWLSQHWQQGMFSRPSAATGKKYPAISSAYSKAVHDAISGKRDTHQALTDLHSELVAIMR